MPLQNGTILNERYSICRILGSGGMAQVYLAEDLKNGQYVAVKMLKPEFNDDNEFLRRFDTEARAASSLSHDSIVKVLGVGEDQGMRYMVQEYVDGVTLKEMILHYHRLDWRVAVPIFVQIAMALESAHAGGVIHRDIKPQNIIINNAHHAYVTDFGIARANNQNTIAGSSSSTLGSVHYFSPEQAQGGIVSERSDIYSLGVLMYETLTGSLPFDADTSVSIALKHLNEKPIAPIELEPLIPQALSDIVLKCLNKSPNTRYTNARALINELDAFMINPQGTFGISLDNQQRNTYVELSSNQKKDSNATPKGLDKLEKIRFIEETMTKRRSSRRRETGLVFSLIAIALVVLVATIFYFVDQFRQELASNTTPGIILANFVGHSLSESEDALNKVGISADVEYVFSDKYDEGIVVKQNLNANSKFYPNGLQRLVLTVSKGSDLLKLKNYVGQQATKAQADLSALGLNFEIKEIKNDDFEKGFVVKQSPAPESVLKKDETITLYVSDGSSTVTFEPQQGKSTSSTVEWLKSQGLVVNEIILESSDSSLTVDKSVVNYVCPAGEFKAYVGGDRLEVGTRVDVHAVSPADIAAIQNATATENNG